MEALHALRGELEGLLSGQAQEDTRPRIDAAVAAFQALREAPAPEPVPVHAIPEPEPAAPAIVVPFPAPPVEREPEAVETAPQAPEHLPDPAPRWVSRVRPDGARPRQASLFDQPRPVASEAETRAAPEKSWRKAAGGKPAQLSLF